MTTPPRDWKGRTPGWRRRGWRDFWREVDRSLASAFSTALLLLAMIGLYMVVEAWLGAFSK